MLSAARAGRQHAAAVSIPASWLRFCSRPAGRALSHRLARSADAAPRWSR